MKPVYAKTRSKSFFSIYVNLTLADGHRCPLRNKKRRKTNTNTKKNKIKTKRENRFHDDAIECR